MTMSVSAETRNNFEQFVLPTYARFPLEFVRGEGCRIWDAMGHEYLDFGAGIAVCALGHCHPATTEAIARQAGTLLHTSNLYHTAGQGRLAKRLVQLVDAAGRVFFCNSGAEANEGLIKLARKYAYTTGCGPEIITFTGSFHGRTLAGISATAQEKVKTGFAPLLPGFLHVEFGDIDQVRKVIGQQTAAILVEPVQGEGGIHPATATFLRQLREVCDEHRALLLFDEVQCGLGRTGDWCGWKSLGCRDVMPDGVSWAKGIAGGFPLGGFYVRERVIQDGLSLADILSPGSHGTTFGGNPLACAAAHSVLDVIEREDLLSNATRMGTYARKSLLDAGLPYVKEVRGVGLMLGIELEAMLVDRARPEVRRSTAALTVVEALHEERLLCIPAGPNVARWLPPLNVTQEEIDEAMGKLKRVLTSL